MEVKKEMIKLKTYTSAHASLDHFNSMLRLVKKDEPTYFEFDINDLSEELLDRHRKLYPWHFKDSIRSFTNDNITNLSKYEFSYQNRFKKYFKVDQFDYANKSIINTWDPKIDLFAIIKPCLLILKFIRDGEYLHLSVVYRKRDLIKRLIPNWCCLCVLLTEQAQKFNLKPKLLLDYSIQATYNDKDRLKWIMMK